jgi:hypothetical protein
MRTFSNAYRPCGRASIIQVRRATPARLVWIDLLEKYLPKRYQAATAHIVDSLGNFSQQIDVVVFEGGTRDECSPETG